MRTLTAALLLALSLAACKKPDDAATPGPAKKDAALPALKVETGDVLHQQMPRYLTLTGSVMADKQSEVAANVAGRVATTYVERGMPVKAGQVMAIVDSKAAGFQAAAANAQSQAAETQVAAARQDCDRADTLFKQGAMAKSEFDRQKAQCTAQLFQANAARANADLAGKLAGDTIIRAPIDGIVGERYVNVGEYVQPSSKVASIFSVDPVRVSISVPERAVAQILPNQTLDLTVTAYGSRVFPATVKFISPALRQGTRDLIIEATAENKDLSLKPGMFATVLLSTGEEEQPTVPLDAIKSEGTIKRMFLAREGQAYELVVRTGVEKDGRIAVLEPLEQGQKVIIKPPPGLRDGTSIQLSSARPPAPAGSSLQ